MVKASSQDTAHDLTAMLESFDERISRVEHELGIHAKQMAAVSQVASKTPSEQESEDFEFEVGVNWFARFGIVALAIGLAFLLTFPYDGVSPFLPSVFGFILVIVLFGAGHALRTANLLVSRYIIGGGIVLFYFSILRLYFFSSSVLLNRAEPLQCMPLLVGSVFVLAGSYWRSSAYLFSLSLIMAGLSILVLGNETGVLVLLPVLSAISVVVAKQKSWNQLFILGPLTMFLVYGLMMVNNPVIGNPLQFVQMTQSSLFTLHAIVIIFAFGQYLISRDVAEEFSSVVAAGATMLPYYALLGLQTIGLPQSTFLVHHAIAHVILLASATMWWVTYQSRYRTFGFAMLGYLALSVVILRAVTMPDAFIWLEMQSLLVLSTAIWFRSRFIVVANFFLYLIILVTYVVTVEGVNLIGLSIGVVALMSARIMNWQHQRLELKTESMRNAYLGAAFLTFPFMLYRLVPSKYVSLAWVCVALLYYGLNFLIKAQKYRWMGHLTLLLTVLYTLVIGIIGLDATYRIVSFLILGIVLLAASLIFARQRAAKVSSSRTPNTGTVEDVAESADDAG